MAMKPDSRVRRCRCHRWVVNADFDDQGKIVRRFCGKTQKDLTLDQTYLATWGSPEEIVIDPGPEVQRGTRFND